MMKSLICLSVSTLIFFVSCLIEPKQSSDDTVTLIGPTNIVVGQTIQLTNSSANTNATYIMTYDSSDSNIAIVDTNGFVTGVAQGNVIITLTLSITNSTITGTHNLRVFIPSVGPILLGGPTNVEVGHTIQLTNTAMVTDGTSASVSYSSSDPSIAIVDVDGMVTGVGRGNVVITAISMRDNTIMDTHNLRVIIPSVDLVSLTGPTNTTIGNSILLTNMVMTTDGASMSVTYISSDTNIATVDTNGMVIGVASGNVTITAISVVDSFVMSTHNVTVIDGSIRGLIYNGTLAHTTNINAIPTNYAIIPANSAIIPLTAAITPAVAIGDVIFSGNLPAGLNLDTNTGEISGTPTTVAGATDYTITAIAKPSSTLYTGSNQTVVSITVINFSVYGYRLTASTPNDNNNITIQLAEGDILDGAITTDLLAGVIPTGSASHSTRFTPNLFNDGSDDQSVNGIYHSKESPSNKTIQVMGTNALTASSGIFRVRVIGRNSHRHRNNQIVVTLLDENDNPIGTASNPVSGFSRNNYDHDGFVVDFNSIGAVLTQPTIFSTGNEPALPNIR